ncbi:Vta1 like-domain-containing protein [Aspergillus varians]
MASNIPAALKSADVGRFAVRAAQLEKAKPIIAYWCNFYIVNQIIERGLHTSDDEVKLYTTDLMEKLEQFQTENRDNDAIADSMAASAYVEEFGLEVFARAEAAMRADKVTKQTADTFQAAATFLELCQIWNPLEAEVAAKVKFAKYHAVRIAKAIRAGEDPNASNPKIEEEEGQTEDLSQVQLTDLDTAAAPSSQAPLQPRVEDVPDDDSQYAQPSTSNAPHILPQPPTTFTDLPSAPQGPASSRDVDVDPDQDSPLNLPSAPNTFASSAESPSLPDTPTHFRAHHQSKPSNEFQSFPPPSAMPPTNPADASHDVDSFYNAPRAASPPRFVPPAGPRHVGSYPTHQPTPLTTPPVAAPTAPAYANTHDIDDQAISLAQKHARFAVSALTFDDVNTAIKELRNSLKHLGVE